MLLQRNEYTRKGYIICLASYYACMHACEIKNVMTNDPIHEETENKRVKRIWFDQEAYSRKPSATILRKMGRVIFGLIFLQRL